MDDTDRLLHEAGERWRASQPPLPPIDPASLEAPGQRPVPVRYVVAGVAGMAALAIVFGVAAVVRQQVISTAAGGRSACDLTRPNPQFVPPSPYLASPPAHYRSAWFGSVSLWTMLNYEGEAWSKLPKSPDGFSQKTFWWSDDWRPGEEPKPAITVTGSRLHGPGTFSFAGGTNAGADFGVAMLVGVEIPTAGCWQITGQYRDAALSYVVWVEGD